ncbi:hypothetical protein MJ435_05350, partial [Burkholderia gladioli]
MRRIAEPAIEAGQPIGGQLGRRDHRSGRRQRGQARRRARLVLDARGHAGQHAEPQQRGADQCRAGRQRAGAEARQREAQPQQAAREGLQVHEPLPRH